MFVDEGRLSRSPICSPELTIRLDKQVLSKESEANTAPFNFNPVDDTFVTYDLKFSTVRTAGERRDDEGISKPIDRPRKAVPRSAEFRCSVPSLSHIPLSVQH